MKEAILCLMIILFTFSSSYSEATAQPPPTPADEQPEVLNRGPIHEAFAEPVDVKPQDKLTVPAQPPPDIVENPPDERPSGKQFVWVPGYWGWDSERNNYIWVSGCWRAAPPSQYWVPGYWNQTGEGWEWVSGFWAPVSKSKQIEYLPAPPPIDDIEPPGPPPDPGNIWVPPCWYWHHGKYIWRPGYWVMAQQDWVWVPSHYTWTPRGYVFIAGHWDYTLDHRGVLFAPVFFPRPAYIHRGFTFSLGIVVDLGMLQFSMFTCPRYHHYYFGDYYDDTYINIGIYPRFECHKRFTWYDPIYEHDRWRNRKVRNDWEEHLRYEYDRRRVERDLRPPRTYREIRERQSRMPEPDRRSIQMVEPLRTVVTDRMTPLKFERIKTNGQRKITGKAAEVRKFGDERRSWESSSPGQKSNQTRIEGQRSMTPSTIHREPMKPSTETRTSGPPSNGFKGTGVSPQKRGATVNPQSETNVNTPDRVRIPAPPISDKRGAFSIFKNSPPSRPSKEQKIETRDSSSRSRDSQRDDNSYRGR